MPLDPIPRPTPRWDNFVKIISVSTIAAMASAAIILPVLTAVAAAVFAN